MNSTASYRLALPLGLLLLVLCSTGLALKCYGCDWTNQMCTTEQQCDAGLDSCMKLTQTDTGLTKYQCRAYNKCNIQAVTADFSLSANIKLNCCQSNLCNKGFTGLPASGLILFLAAALLVLFS